jgi:cytochrome c553
MKQKLILSALCLVISQAALAETHGHAMTKSWSTGALNQTIAAMPAGDIQRGETLHRNGLCMSCHGAQGVAPSRNAPSLAGNPAQYTFKMLTDYQQGYRNEGTGKSAVMRAATSPMSAQDMADLAAYYETQSVPAFEATTPTAPEIMKLVRYGDVSRMLTACASCHGAKGQGGLHNTTPALAGQTPDYFIRTMQAYKHGKRANDLHQGMAQFAEALSDAEILALANYYAGLNNPTGGAQ